MSEWQIKRWEDSYLAEVIEVWQRVFADRMHDFKVDEGSFRNRALEHACFDPAGALLATIDCRVVGFGLAVASDDESHGYLSVLLVDDDWRGQGIGTGLLKGAEDFLGGRGKDAVRVGYRGNPISFATGVDVSTPAHRFLLNRGFRNDGSASLVMELQIADFEWREEIDEHIRTNEARGIRFGLCNAEHRDALCRFMETHHPGGWERSVKGALDGEGPYPVLVATDGDTVVGFTGPIRVGSDGRGGFSGIGTDPEYRRNKIGTVLFNLLCMEFKRRGATYDVLHTGLRNHAQNIYFGAGFRVNHLVDYSLVKRLKQ
jgi:GNAT superfamily N-acetyltransferase